MHKYIYVRWAESAHWIWHQKRSLLKPPAWMEIEFSRRTDLNFADVAGDLLRCYADSFKPQHLYEDEELSKHYFQLSKAYNELTQLDMLLLKLSYGANTRYLESAYGTLLKRELRQLRKQLDLYLLSRSAKYLDLAMARLERIESKLKQLNSDSITLAGFVTEFQRLYDELLIASLIEQL
jgi:hypothetical protein